MVCWTIENHAIEKTAYTPDRVYDYLLDNFGVDVPDAIEASSWCELACVGEVYHGDGFRITVEEE